MLFSFCSPAFFLSPLSPLSLCLFHLNILLVITALLMLTLCMCWGAGDYSSQGGSDLKKQLKGSLPFSGCFLLVPVMVSRQGSLQSCTRGTLLGHLHGPCPHLPFKGDWPMLVCLQFTTLNWGVLLSFSFVCIPASPRYSDNSAQLCKHSPEVLF